MDATYLHVTPQMRRDCIAVLEKLFWEGIDERIALSDSSPVPILNRLMTERRAQKTAAEKNDPAASSRRSRTAQAQAEVNARTVTMRLRQSRGSEGRLVR
jgi:hypothetical protein